ncbi:hypothetical protein T439DRAFT_328103 [Meredithblackwellia eburnea MCA 4105]
MTTYASFLQLPLPFTPYEARSGDPSSTHGLGNTLLQLAISGIGKVPPTHAVLDPSLPTKFTNLSGNQTLIQKLFAPLQSGHQQELDVLTARGNAQRRLRILDSERANEEALTTYLFLPTTEIAEKVIQEAEGIDFFAQEDGLSRDGVVGWENEGRDTVEVRVRVEVENLRVFDRMWEDVSDYLDGKGELHYTFDPPGPTHPGERVLTKLACYLTRDCAKLGVFCSYKRYCLLQIDEVDNHLRISPPIDYLASGPSIRESVFSFIYKSVKEHPQKKNSLQTGQKEDEVGDHNMRNTHAEGPTPQVSLRTLASETTSPVATFKLFAPNGAYLGTLTRKISSTTMPPSSSNNLSFIYGAEILGGPASTGLLSSAASFGEISPASPSERAPTRPADVEGSSHDQPSNPNSQLKLTIDTCIKHPVSKYRPSVYSTFEGMVLKVASCKTAAKSLERELEAYLALEAIQDQTIPKCEGLFSAGEGSDKTLVLVLENAGKVLSASDGGHDWSSHPIDVREAVYQAAVSVLRHGVRHLDLKPRNVCWNGSTADSVKLIDFHEFVTIDPGSEQRLELEAGFRHILGLVP